MSLKSLYDDGITIYRVLSVRDDSVLVIDCLKRTMPVWMPKNRLVDWQQIEERVLHEKNWYMSSNGRCAIKNRISKRT